MVLNLYNFAQSNPNPEAWLKKMAENFLVPEGLDFSRTPWGEVLLEALELELQDMEHKLREAVGLLQASTGLDKYLPVFQEEYNFMQSLARQFTLSFPQWDKLSRLINSFSLPDCPPPEKTPINPYRNKSRACRMK